jgi:signal transduction histidine kinase
VILVKEPCLGVRNPMPNATNRLFCRLDGLTPTVREQQRANVSKTLGLLETESLPVFEEATQTAARFLEAPICILGLMVHDRLWLKSAVGLSQLGLMNRIATSREIPRIDAYCSYVIDSQQVLAIEDTFQETVFTQSLLAQHYNIRSYLGTPLVTHDGCCIGTLAVMDTVPRQFDIKDIEFLTLIARWCLREFERDHLLQTQATKETDWSSFSQDYQALSLENADNIHKQDSSYSISEIKLKLLRGLTQELRTPLTAVIGMASILCGEVFGPLTQKQREYVNIIHNSGQQVNALVNEILKLGTVQDERSKLQLTPVNLEMLCQQIINDLTPTAQQKRQQLRLSVEPGKRIWMLDRDKVKQAIYYLIISVVESSAVGGEVRVHISRRSNSLNLALWVSHPWLGDGLPQVKLYASALTNGMVERETVAPWQNGNQWQSPQAQVIHPASLEANLIQLKEDGEIAKDGENPQALLSLLLACYLTEQHNGKIVVQGSSESGYRYVLQLPQIAAEET